MVTKIYDLYKSLEQISGKCTCCAKQDLINLKDNILVNNLSTTDKNRHNMYCIYDDTTKQIINLAPALRYINKITFTHPICTIEFKDGNSVQFKYVSRKSKDGIELAKKYTIIDLNSYEKEN